MTGARRRYLADALRSRRRRSQVESDGVTAAPPRTSLLARAQRVAHGLAADTAPRAEPVSSVSAIGHRTWRRCSASGTPARSRCRSHVSAAAATGDSAAAGDRRALSASRHDGIASIAATPPAAARPLLRDAALVIFTSGSTGQPKGVVIGHDRLAAKLDVLDRLLGLSAATVVLVPLQLTFIFGIWVSLLALRSGCRLVLMPKFSPEAIATALAGGATVLAGVPTMLRAMLAAEMPAAPQLRSILTGGEALGDDARAQCACRASPRRVSPISTA